MKRFLLCCLVLCGAHLSAAFTLDHNDQLVLVVSENWNSPEAQMWCFEKKDSKDRWHIQDSPKHVTLGLKGMAWGRGLQPLKKLHGPVKKEADDRSPAGIFRIGPIISTQPKAKDKRFKMPYIYITPSMVAVDDTHSHYYNQIVDTKYIKPEWTSAMQLKDHSFLKWAALVEYNCHPAIPKEGSCIFLCIDNEESTQQHLTSTCLPENELLSVLSWLKQAKRPVLVQLPMSEYKKFKKSWHLPEIE